MKKTGLLLVLLAVAACAQTADSAPAASIEAPQNTVVTNASFPHERIQTPTSADLYCAGFISKVLLPDANFVAGGLNSPSTTKFANGDIIYLQGSGYQTGQQYTIIRELRDPNQGEVYPGQRKLVAATGHPYAEIGRARVIDTRSHAAVAQVEFSCDPINPGDVAVLSPKRRPSRSTRPCALTVPARLEQDFWPHRSGQGFRLSARDRHEGLYECGIQPGRESGDYFRAMRPTPPTCMDPVDSLSFTASTTEDTQARPAAIEPTMLTRTKGPRSIWRPSASRNRRDRRAHRYAFNRYWHDCVCA